MLRGGTTVTPGIGGTVARMLTIPEAAQLLACSKNLSSNCSHAPKNLHVSQLLACSENMYSQAQKIGGEGEQESDRFLESRSV
jgi:hypothetical protein